MWCTPSWGTGRMNRRAGEGRRCWAWTSASWSPGLRLRRKAWLRDVEWVDAVSSQGLVGTQSQSGGTALAEENGAYVIFYVF
jgi:hypothetical protein